MSARKQVSIVDGIAGDILRTSGRAMRRQKAAAEAAVAEIQSVETYDYGPALRKCLSRGELRQILKEARAQVWPHLNRTAVKLVSPAEFLRHWSRLGIDFRVANWSWPSGKALLGFYIRNSNGGLHRPLICVNGAHHPAMVGLTFDHEMGHHVTRQLFGSREPVGFLLYASYKDHLTDPAELAADVLVSVGVCPQDTAIEIFRRRGDRRSGDASIERTGALELSLRYVGQRYRWRLDLLPFEEKLHCLAVVSHYAKLRQALLDEYDI